jgi:hypothetical protein
MISFNRTGWCNPPSMTQSVIWSDSFGSFVASTTGVLFTSVGAVGDEAEDLGKDGVVEDADGEISDSLWDEVSDDEEIGLLERVGGTSTLPLELPESVVINRKHKKTAKTTTKAAIKYF